MADDWQPGDLALCIDDSDGGIERAGAVVRLLERGKVYRVEAVDIDPAFAEVGLHLEGVPRPWSEKWQTEIGWLETRFRKIRPHTPDAEDAETIRLLQGAPIREPAA
ncbi:MAG: hypothetical protein PWP11_3269 [Thauera sp.]|nr:hypothetical protein [Thauera sp.]MDI3491992.1 hypothetical protein [Thauera sp.]